MQVEKRHYVDESGPDADGRRALSWLNPDSETGYDAVPAELIAAAIDRR